MYGDSRGDSRRRGRKRRSAKEAIKGKKNPKITKGLQSR